MQASKVLSRLSLRPVRRNFASHTERHPTMNDLPQPKGDWKSHYEANNRRYNLQLGIGVVALIGTIVAGKAAGWLEFYNDYPDAPADIKYYK